MTATAYRLPGIQFETQPPQPAEVLPRMDVAVFVGLAAAGPIDTPVALEDAARFTAIFGPDLRLAWDAERGETLHAQLAPAVRAFFRNGGRRCWIIRLARGARFSSFPVPNLAQVERSADGVRLERIRPAFARARSAGAWADAYSVAAAVARQPVGLSPVSLAGLVFDLDPEFVGTIVVGDLVQCTFGGSDYILLFTVDTVAQEDEARPRSARPLRLTGSNAMWFRAGYSASPPAPPDHVLSSVPLAVRRWQSLARGAALAVELDCTLAAAPVAGSLISADFGSDQLWLAVRSAAAGKDGVLVEGQGMWWLRDAPAIPDAAPVFEKLGLELWVRSGGAQPVRFGGLGFDPRHPRYWDALPTDEELYSGSADPLYTGLWRAAAEPRFSLAGSGSPSAFSIPIAMALLPGDYVSPAAEDADAATRNGAAEFSADLFLDPELGNLETRTDDLMEIADFLRYQSPMPRRLRGIHAALGVDEATLVAVPDAVHRGWSRAVIPDPKPGEEAVSVAPARATGEFIDCSIETIGAPEFATREQEAAAGFTLAWSSSGAGLRYVLEESASPDFSGAEIAYAGPEERATIYSRRPGIYYYRVMASSGSASSNWSKPAWVRVAGWSRMLVKREEDFSDSVLVAVHRSLLRMSAARGDLLALLTLPEHYRAADAAAHAAVLAAPSGPVAANIAPLGYGEARALSYGALYHPWLLGRESDGVRRTAPDGVALGTLAARALSRGAWMAPANVALQGVLALTPGLDGSRPDAPVNYFTQEPRGFVALTADTLSGDPELCRIHVRRLMILLRRLALRAGATYAFEPHDDAFRRLVQRGFETLLGNLFARGAFAGQTRGEAFQVVADASVNPPESVDQGRLVVELRVAPSQPLTFLTIRLVQTGERASALEVG